MNDLEGSSKNPELEAKMDDPSLKEEIPEKILSECESQEVIKIFLKPEKINQTSILFKIPQYGGQELKRGQKIIFVIPKEFREEVLRETILGHRKDANKYGGYDERKRDPNGAYSKVTSLDSRTGNWVGWSDKYGSVKFAEPRSAYDPEEENLHDFLNCSGIITPEAICIENAESPDGQAKDISKTTSNIHYLIINFYPHLSENMEQTTLVYTEGTTFSDLPIKNYKIKRTLPKYGDYNGGDISVSIMGYPKAIPLNLKSHVPPFEINKNPETPAHLINDELFVDLQPGKNLKYVEVACGDTRPPSNPGEKSKVGGARLNIGLKKADTGEIIWFSNSINVPPKGVLNGSPKDENYIIQSGDQLVLRSTASHSTYVMALRLTYDSKKNIDSKYLLDEDGTLVQDIDPKDLLNHKNSTHGKIEEVLIENEQKKYLTNRNYILDEDGILIQDIDEKDDGQSFA